MTTNIKAAEALCDDIETMAVMCDTQALPEIARLYREINELARQLLEENESLENENDRMSESCMNYQECLEELGELKQQHAQAVEAAFKAGWEYAIVVPDISKKIDWPEQARNTAWKEFKAKQALEEG